MLSFVSISNHLIGIIMNYRTGQDQVMNVIIIKVTGIIQTIDDSGSRLRVLWIPCDGKIARVLPDIMEENYPIPKHCQMKKLNLKKSYTDFVFSL